MQKNISFVFSMMCVSFTHTDGGPNSQLSDRAISALNVCEWFGSRTKTVSALRLGAKRPKLFLISYPTLIQILILLKPKNVFSPNCTDI